MACSSPTVRILDTSTVSCATVMALTGSARLHPVQEVDEILSGRAEHVEIADRLRAGRLDVVWLPRRDEDERTGPDRMTDAVHVIDRGAGHDRGDLVEVLVHVREELHARGELVQHEERAVVAEGLPANAFADDFVGDLVPGRGDRAARGLDGCRRRGRFRRGVPSRFVSSHVQMRDTRHARQGGQVANVAAVRRADLLIANARLVTPRGVVEGGAAISDGKFVAIGAPETLPDAETRIDAKQRLVFPGLVDPHVHLGGAFPYEQNLVTESLSAAAGGITTLLQYRRSPSTFFETFPAELETNRRKMALDTAFHFIISSLEQAEGIPEYAARWGVRSYKLYMGGYAPGNPIGLVAVDDGVFYRSMELIRQLGPYAHCMCHAENQGLYLLFDHRAHESGRLDLSAYAMSHPDFIEHEAVARLIWLGERTRCPVYVVHTTTGAALETAKAARRRGARVTIETCPHYLALTIDDARLASQGPAI